jgi:predicted regulator of Ras-like GTPase activity (Roadblock/LC7/MglB family)
MARVEGVSSTPHIERGVKPFDEIMRELVSISDVDGAAILRKDGSVISWCTSNGVKPIQYINFIHDYISGAYQKKIHNNAYGMFNESIIDYNGHKLLMSRIKKDLILMLMLKKSAYLGLTMLDVEGCLREIDKNLDEGTFGIREIPG